MKAPKPKKKKLPAGYMVRVHRAIVAALHAALERDGHTASVADTPHGAQLVLDIKVCDRRWRCQLSTYPGLGMLAIERDEP